MLICQCFKRDGKAVVFSYHENDLSITEVRNIYACPHKKRFDGQTSTTEYLAAFKLQETTKYVTATCIHCGRRIKFKKCSEESIANG